MDKSPDAFRTISEVAEHLQTPAHVLRFWESRFPQIRPVKRAGGRRYYRPSDVALLSGIRRLLHDEGLTIRGVQKILREQGVRHVSGLSDEEMDAANAAADTVDAGALPAAEIVWLHGAAEAAPPLTPAPFPRAPDDAEDGLDMVPEAVSDADLRASALPAPLPGPDGGDPATDPPAAQPGLPQDQVDMADTPAPADPDPADPDPAEAPAPVDDGDLAVPPRPLPPDDLPLFALHQPAPPAPLPPAPAAGDDLAALAARLRALSPGVLAHRRDEIAPLFDRLAGLRNRLADRGRGPRR